MSLGITLLAHDADGNGWAVFDYNITHNLNRMADAAGIYEAMWRPDEHGYVHAGDIIDVLDKGLVELRSTPLYFKGMNPKNGWGNYEGLVKATSAYLAACRQYPSAEISVWR